MPDEPNRDITPERKIMYYARHGLHRPGDGALPSVFVTGCANFGNFDNFEGEAKSSMARAIGGMVLMMIGSGLMVVGRLGNGRLGRRSSIRARCARTWSPGTAPAGGMTNDALGEIDVVKKLEKKLDEPSAPAAAPSGPVVKVRLPGLQDSQRRARQVLQSVRRGDVSQTP